MSSDEKSEPKGCRSKLFSIIRTQDQPPLFSAAWFYWIYMFILSITAICCYVAQSNPIYFARPLSDDSYRSFRAILFLELVCMSLLALDLICRCICSPRGWRYTIKPATILEVIYFVFYYVSFIIMLRFEASDDLSSATSAGYSIVRVLTIVRVLGVVRLVRFFETTHVIGAALKRNFLAFGLLIILVFITSLFYGSLIYYAEKQRESFDQTRLTWLRPDNSTSPFQSIYGSMWWAIVTLCTVGYGDAVPVTDGGKVVGAATMITGILVLALPTGIVASTFGDIWREYVSIRLAREREALATRFGRKTNDPDGQASTAVEMENADKGSTSTSSSKKDKERAWVAASVDPGAPLPNRKSTTRDLAAGGKFLSAEEVLGIVESIKKHQDEIKSLVNLLEEKALLQTTRNASK